MASDQELMQALRAADAAGDAAAATAIATRLASQRSATSQTADMPKAYGIGDFAVDFGKGAIASAANIGQTLTKPIGWFSKDFREYMDRSQRISNEMREESGAAGALGGFVTDVAGTGGIGGVVKNLALRGARHLPRAASLSRGAGLAATEGALSGAYLSPEDPLKGAGFGAAGGVAGQQLLSRSLSRLAKPVDLSKYADADALMQAGVPLTVGLGANPNTVGGRGLRLLEETLSSAPFVGGSIRGQREAARQAWRDIPLHDAAQLSGVPKPSRAGFATHAQMQEQVREDIGKRYEKLLGGKELRPTGTLHDNLDMIVQNPKLSMTAADRKRARDLVEAHIYGRQVDYSRTPPAAPPTVTAQDIFKAQSDLRKLGERALQSDLSSEQAFGQALINSADEVYKFITRRFPTMGRELQNLRAPYAQLSTLRAAAEKAGARGEFNPTQLGKIASKRGDDTLKQWAAIAEPLLTKDPGNISNLARLSLLTGSGILVGAGSLPVAGAAALLFGTKTGQRALQGNTAAQKQLSRLLAAHPELSSRAGGVLGREAALGMSNTQDY